MDYTDRQQQENAQKAREVLEQAKFWFKVEQLADQFEDLRPTRVSDWY